MGVHTSLSQGLDLVLPTDNDALFSGDGAAFYQYVERDYKGVKSTPWEGGKYGFVRDPTDTAGGVVYTRFHEGIDIRPLHRMQMATRSTKCARSPMEESSTPDLARLFELRKIRRDRTPLDGSNYYSRMDTLARLQAVRRDGETGPAHRSNGLHRNWAKSRTCISIWN